jgi:hypothetical protein
VCIALLSRPSPACLRDSVIQVVFGEEHKSRTAHGNKELRTNSKITTNINVNVVVIERVEQFT